MNTLSILDKFNNIKSIQDSIIKSKNYIGDIKNKNPRIYNSWRDFMYTEKGIGLRMKAMVYLNFGNILRINNLKDKYYLSFIFYIYYNYFYYIIISNLF